MADEALRMQAEVQDRFSGPLKALRSQLLDTARTGANHSDTLVKGFKAVEGTMQSTARVASSVVNPAFAAIGVTGLSVGAAVAGITGALNKLTGNMTALGQLSRETGVAAKALQEFGAVAGRFGIEQDAVASGAKNFAAQMRTFSRSTGEAFNWVIRQGTDAAGRKAFQDFATDLQHTSDEGEKLKKALAFMETIKNPVEKGIFAQQFFGNQDLARIADGHLGPVVELFKKAREKLGEFSEKDIIDAEKFDRSLSSLKGSMQRFGITIAREVLGPATEFTTWMDSLVSGERADLTKSLREGLQGVKKELGEINWKQAGDDAASFLKDSTALAGTLAKAFHEIAETIHNLREGNIAQAIRGAGEDAANGSLARSLAPRVGDDEIAATQEVERLTKLRDVAREAAGHLVGRTQQRLGVLDTPEAAQQKLNAADARLEALQGRTPEQRQKDFEASDKLRRSIDSLTDEMKASRGGATVQKQSMDTQGGLFGGATIQSASFGGGGFRRLGGFGGGGYGGGANLPGGGSGPGYNGEQGAAGGGGRFNGLGGSRPSIAPIGPRPALPRLGASIPGVPDNVPMTADERNTLGLIQKYESHGQNTMNYVGRQQGISPLAARGYTAQGYYQILNSNWRRLAPGLGITAPNAMAGTLEEQTRVALALLRSRGGKPKDWAPFNPSLRAAIARGEQAPAGTVPAIASRSATASAILPDGTPRLLKPNSMGGAPGVTMDQANAMREGRADGAGWAAREAARKTFEAQQADAAGLRSSGARVAASAARAGVVATPTVEANGSVVVNVHKPGPETRVATTASGKLFQDVVQRSGAQMRRAD